MAALGTSNVDIYPLVLGGNVFGWTCSPEESFAVLDAFVEAGGTMIDTADMYAQWVPGQHGGESETILGQWLARRGRRDDVLIATKVGLKHDRKGLAPATIETALDESLRRLGVDYVDLYYTHRDDPEQPAAEIMGTLNALVEKGKVRLLGASNLSGARLDELMATAAEAGGAQYVCVQPHYNLVERAGYEQDLAPAAARHGLSALPYYALASGFLTGKYRPATEGGGAGAPQSDRASTASAYLDKPHGPAVLSALEEVAARHRVAPATVALAWLQGRPTVAAPIASARNPEQLAPLMAAADLRLTDAERAHLDGVSGLEETDPE